MKQRAMKARTGAAVLAALRVFQSQTFPSKNCVNIPKTTAKDEDADRKPLT